MDLSICKQRYGHSFFYWSLLDFIRFGGLGVACWPLVLMFTGSNPAEAIGFLG